MCIRDRVYNLSYSDTQLNSMRALEMKLFRCVKGARKGVDLNLRPTQTLTIFNIEYFTDENNNVIYVTHLNRT